MHVVILQLEFRQTRQWGSTRRVYGHTYSEVGIEHFV